MLIFKLLLHFRMKFQKLFQENAFKCDIFNKNASTRVICRAKVTQYFLAECIFESKIKTSANVQDTKHSEKRHFMIFPNENDLFSG